MQNWIENFRIFFFLKNLEIFFSEIFCSHFRINDTWWFECETEKNVEKRKIVLRERERERECVCVCVCVCVEECVWERERESMYVCLCVREREGYCSFFSVTRACNQVVKLLTTRNHGSSGRFHYHPRYGGLKTLGQLSDEKYDRKSRRAISSKNNSDKPKHAHKYNLTLLKNIFDSLRCFNSYRNLWFFYFSLIT